MRAEALFCQCSDHEYATEGKDKLKPIYKRIILKLSGEALAGEQGFGLDEKIIEQVVDQLIRVHKMGVEIGIVLGGGNFWRGRQGTKMDRTTADHMGMLATVINSLAMQDAIEQKGVPTRVQTALNMISVAEPFILRKAVRHFELGRIVIFACGTGNPYCSTDTGAMEVINRGLKAMDTTAITMCMDNNIPVLAFALSEKDAIVRAICGERTGTLITNE